ncbi:hypothetical protein A3G55_01315 [Candidatus Giovannonibacteria bacterium RIFCSPLOWO2_12_FULL_44_25]|uniref:Protein NO VEIN C-terminal domain-containing protein n=1 Tax=Candidatus Giovannonibacteria bacterium RIFCSPHIGHO2_02_FULL_45_40 TaxID=1798337 RepID=A0A1F5W906_9BACT|nr:MAG: Helicase domain protein [Candidatus Giovannonibacteria bacterium GW2011_GWB1_46_20]OGF59756.1 MAG: hypothetical protein A2W40_01440 [Candidatus Giovannonibacteria bacterium RIFCSPHIGHO2_01_45_12]OGF60962.1 MAG: hypothetical protein A2656_01765 [Candidatus Giovannonibacteria bacterium RIFCSPHIGHO2_01_FULL_44_100]OGF72137.1 MAG: hypothetical protein A3C05_02835 [Candidatus Giovannonibacteria bacterium RIFCSPHIGHO2_02_FULL_45_40]OGF84528.1 MAG: hypothetical protein A3A19_00150 [Candidatus 
MVVRYPEKAIEFSPSRTEKQAIEIVMEYERKNGRKPEEVSNKKCGYDIKSGDRFIEVKGQKAKQPDVIGLYKTTLSKLGDNILHYFIYLVYDIKSNPKLKILPPEKIFGNIEMEQQFIIRGKIFKNIPIEQS